MSTTSRVNRLAASSAAWVLLVAACGESTKPPTLADLAFTPDVLMLVTGDTVASPATARDARGATMPGTIMYRTDDAAVASVSANGRVVAEGPGTTTITATMGGTSGELRVTVVPPTVQGVAFAVDTATVTVAGTRTLRATVTDPRGRTVVVPLTYETSDASIATVDDTGFVTLHHVGTATITARAGTATAGFRLTVVPQFIQVAAGGSHTCGISGTGRTYCWGSLALGQQNPQHCSAIGAVCSSTPVEIYGGLQLKALTAGSMHTCGLDGSGAAWCWGNNHAGQVGSRIGPHAAVPTAVAGNLQFATISAGWLHTCGVTLAGEAWCWGNDSHGQLGAGAVAPDRCEFAGEHPCSMLPVKVAGGLSFTDIVVSTNVTCGLAGDGRVYCWGLEVGGVEQEGCQGGEVARCARSPVLQAGGATFAALRSGDSHRCAQAAAGTLECWGANAYGTFGNGSVTNRTDTPVPAAGGMTFASIVAARLTMCGRTDAGAAYCWGANGAGEVGSGSTVPVVESPSPVAGGLTFNSLWSGSVAETVCGVAASGRAYCWGKGNSTQLGNASMSSSAVPVAVAGLK